MSDVRYQMTEDSNCFNNRRQRTDGRRRQLLKDQMTEDQASSSDIRHLTSDIWQLLSSVICFYLNPNFRETGK